MAMTLTTQNTVLGALQPKDTTARWASALFTIVLGTILLTISAKLSVPTWPVPVTLQTMAIAAIAGAFGWRIGLATVSLYILQGFVGLPVFATGSGPAYILGPTGGFIVGWLPMTLLIGYAADRGASSNFFKLFAAMVAGGTIMFALGFGWLALMAGAAGWIDQTNVLASAFEKAVAPFIVWDLLKMAFAALTVYGGWQLVKGRKS